MPSTIDNSSYVDSLRWQQEDKQTNEKSDTLTQEDYFALMTQQLSFQDPTKPADNDQMIAQMTNFSMADGINNLNEKFEAFSESMTSNSALQASTLVGKNALVPSEVIDYKLGENAEGSVTLDSNVQNLTVRIEDGIGQSIQVIQLGNQPQGNAAFSWDGMNIAGNLSDSGQYKVIAEGKVGDEYVTFPVSTFKNVESVSFGGTEGIRLNTSSGSFNLSEVEEIGQG